MRKLNLLFFAVFCIISISNAQTYKFDLLTKYVIAIENSKTRERVVYSNSDNQQYFLLLRKTKRENVANLTDLTNSKVHFFRFNETTENGQIFFTFKYLRTEKLQQFDVGSNYRFKFETIKEDSIYKTIKMTAFQDKEMTKVHRIMELRARKHRKNLFPTFRYSVMHVFEFRTDIDPSEGYIVESSKLIGRNEYASQLTDYREISLTLIVD